MSEEKLPGWDTREWREREQARLEAVHERLCKPIKSALLDSLERVYGPVRKSTPEEREQLLKEWHARYGKKWRRL